MIRKIRINLSAEHPEIPLIEGATFVGSPSAVFVSGVPQAVGSWRITSVKVVATYPDDSAPTVECVKGADGVYVATIPATATSGRVANGLQIIADGIDERGEAVTGYVLGIADFAVYLRDMTIEGAAGVKYYLHLLNAEPTDPKEGDAYLDGSTLAIYHNGEWTEIAGGGYEPPPGGIPKSDLSAGVQTSLDKADSALQTAPVTSVNGKTGAVSLTASDVGAMPSQGGKISYLIVANPNDTYRVAEIARIGLACPLVAARGKLGIFLIAGYGTASEKEIGFWCDDNGVMYLITASGYVQVPNATSGGTLALLSDIPSVAGLAPLNSPAFTGTPTAPTAAAGTNTTQIATTAFVQNAIGGITPGPDNTKLNSTSAAPAFSSSATYAVGDYVTYEGNLYVCSTAITTAADWDSTKWTAANMTSPDATFDVTSQNALRLVDANGNRLWMQGYDLETPTVTSGAVTLSNESVNYIELASTASADATVTLSLPARSTGKVSDFVLDVANKSSANTLTLSLDSTALDTTFGVVVPDGNDLTTMFTIAAGEMAEFYFTLTQFTKTPSGGSGTIPMYKIVKQVVVDATASQGA